MGGEVGDEVGGGGGRCWWELVMGGEVGGEAGGGDGR